MSKIITYNLNENFIESLAGYIDENFLKKGSDLSCLLFVFEGKRPSLFLKRALSKKIGRGFLSPKFFSIDEFIQYTLSKKFPFTKIPNMESSYMIYALAKKLAPEIIKGRERFSEFLPWGREISDFINTLDMENISQESLRTIQASAAIGYDIPDNINASLKNIVILREAYHQELLKTNRFSKGFSYLLSAGVIPEVNFDEFEKIFFCGFFYMEKTERQIIKYLLDTDKAFFFFQGDEDSWPVLKNISREFSCSVKPKEEKRKDFSSLNLYTAFDRHSQVCTVREILKKIKKLDSTVIILPDSNSMIPLVSELGEAFGDFNVSLGYPLKRSSLYSLFEFIFQAQETKKKTEYYAKDYITALSHPLVKNLKITSDYSVTRILVHKIEEALLGMEETPVSGNLFVELNDIESERNIFRHVAGQTDIEVSIKELQDILKTLHLALFKQWEEINNFQDFARSLGDLLDTLLNKTFIRFYPLNLKIAERMYSIKEELENAPFSREHFLKDDIFKIFRNMLEKEMVNFLGSPLKGLQILGMLETRALNFENVIIMDANESVLPKMKIYDPLIPYDIKLGLGIDIVGNEEEIQRYLFRRAVSGAGKVHIIYEDNGEKEKSRFIEELIWMKQKESKSLDVVSPSRVGFSVNVLPDKMEIKKNEQILSFLKNRSYSASSVNTYLNCPLQFYYRYVLGLKEKEDFLEEPEGKDIGTFIHSFLEKTFAGFINKAPEFNQKFRRNFFNRFEAMFKEEFYKKMHSDSFLLKEVMHFRMEQFLRFEENSEERKVARILYLEEKFNEEIELSGDRFKFTYIVDRVDRLLDGSVLILDYKTGSSGGKPQSIKQLKKMEMIRESIRDRIKSFQLPLYYYFEKRKYKNEVLNAALYNLKQLKLDYFPGKNAEPLETIDICLKALGFILHEILDPDKTFAADSEDENKCRYCPFFYLCR